MMEPMQALETFLTIGTAVVVAYGLFAAAVAIVAIRRLNRNS